MKVQCAIQPHVRYSQKQGHHAGRRLRKGDAEPPAPSPTLRLLVGRDSSRAPGQRCSKPLHARTSQDTASLSLPSRVCPPWSHSQEHHLHPHHLTPSINARWKCPLFLQALQHAAWALQDPRPSSPAWRLVSPCSIPPLDPVLPQDPHRA